MCVRSRYGNKNITLKHFIMIITIRRSRRANERLCETWKLQSWMKNDDSLSVMHGSLRIYLEREHFSVQQWRSLKSNPSLLEYLHSCLLLIFGRALEDEELMNCWRRSQRRTFPPQESLTRKRKTSAVFVSYLHIWLNIITEFEFLRVSSPSFSVLVFVPLPYLKAPITGDENRRMGISSNWTRFE